MFKALKPVAQEALHKSVEENIGVLSLTSCPQNLLMWAHYANSHQGLLFEFDEQHEFFNKKISCSDELRHLREVKYQPGRPKIVLTKCDNFDVFLIKGLDWEYEKELRMLLPLRDAENVIDAQPYAIHLFKIPFSCIRSVTIGGRASEGTVENVKNILKRKRQ